MTTSQLAPYLPAAAVAYGEQLHTQFKFTLCIVTPRRTRLGDFRVFPDGRQQITVNSNLNPYAFLITYVHEVAHAAVFQAYRTSARRSQRPKPHGVAWQTAFRDLMKPILTEAVFPASILLPLLTYLQRPAATTSASPHLMAALRSMDPPKAKIDGQVKLADVAEGQSFEFQKKIFVRGALRRTRIVCKEAASGRQYAILAQADVLIHA